MGWFWGEVWVVFGQEGTFVDHVADDNSQPKFNFQLRASNRSELL